MNCAEAWCNSCHPVRQGKGRISGRKLGFPPELTGVLLDSFVAAFRARTARFEASEMTDLLQKARSRTHCGHTVRLMSFGSLPAHASAGRFTVISLGHVQKFLEEYLHQHWDVLCHAQFKDPAFGFEVLLEKARRGNVADRQE